MCFSGKSWIFSLFEDMSGLIKNYSLEIKFATDAITKLVSSVIARVKVFEFAVKG